ncbi:MAG: hypothetical protein A2017_07780 [Lentisphaerae bacterium GWF2_44_16]|nr:MAG: hypothetical protein A2017_07780 [Lentisphaerae bacterium GWF2_44_16]
MCNHSYKGITLDGQAIEITVHDDKIRSIKDIRTEPGLSYILPPLVDLQQNGALGTAFNELNHTAPEQLRKIGDHLIRNGVGRVLATITTCPYVRLEQAVKAFDRALSADAELSALFPGIFHEGVFISPEEGWRGGHLPEFIRPPDWDAFQHLDELSGGRIKMLNIAPEGPGALDFIEKAVSAGKKVSLGHCRPDTAIIREAVRRGASMVTHFANGAAVHIHRFKNPFWEFLNNDALTLGLVGDGFHLPPETVQTALKIKGMPRCFMVSDANANSGSPPGRYRRNGGCDCIIEPNGFVHLDNDQLLAGAWFQNNRSVEFLVNKVGLKFRDAWRLCSEIPAQIMGIKLTEFKAGEEASFVVADWNDSHLKIKQSVFCGKKYL